jgi:phosphoglycerol transferase MdoB-like AlkP superfamily enzyme
MIPQRFVEKFNRFLGPYQPIVILYVIGLSVLSLSRVGLALWQAERISATGIHWVTFFLQGFRADIIQVSLLCVPLLVMVPVLANRWTWPLFRLLSYAWLLLAVLFLIFLEASTPSFILQYDLRPNRLFVEYLKYPKEVLSTLWNGFRVPLVLGIGISVLLVWSCKKLVSFWLKAPWTWGYLKQLCFFPVIGFLIFAGIRSTADHRPANPALFALTGDPLVNGLIINSSWSVVHAIYNLKHEARSSEVYGKMPVEEMLRETKLWVSEQQTASESPLRRWHEASRKRERPLNLVIILEESLGATFVESLGGLPMTPELEKLKDDGWWFENLYATGTRSVRGIEAVTAGFLPTPARSVVKLSLSQSNFFTIASLLGERNYSTEFIYGGEAHFDNMRLFFTGNGFQSIIEQKDYVNPIFEGTWGVSDEDLFKKTDERISQLHKSGKPFFSLVFTSSNHEPFEYPEGRIERYDQEAATVNNAVKYADYSLGKFFETAKTRDYWKDTLFLVVADHDTRAYGKDLVPIKNFHIAGLILGADLEQKKIKSVTSQVDLPTTLLSLMGISAQHPMIGRNLSSEPEDEPGRAFMQFAENFCMMEGNEVVILRPEKHPTYGHYDRASKALKLTDTPMPERARRALAYALVPSWLYRNQLYR